MQIQTITPVKILPAFNNQKSEYQNNPTKQTEPEQNRNVFAYRDFNISFGARINRTPKDFNAQDFNANNMPETMKKYLREDFETRKSISPLELQKEAFAWLQAADTVQEVKESYPDEKLFQDLKSYKHKQSKVNVGYLYELRLMTKGSKTPIIKDKPNEDLSVYLLKKIYLEGKTLKQINEDFAKDVSLEFKSKKVLTEADLNSLGIEFPASSYWNSIQSIKDSTEISSTIKQNFYTNLAPEIREEKKNDKISKIEEKPVISEKTRQKMSEVKTSDMDLISPQSLKKAFIESNITVDLKYFSEDFKQKFISYLQRTKIEDAPMYLALLFNNKNEAILKKTPEELNTLKNYVMDELYKINVDFDEKYPLEYKSNEFAMNKTLYKITNDPEVFKNTRADSLMYIKAENLDEKFCEEKKSLEKDYSNYIHKLSDSTTQKFYDEIFIPEFKAIRRNGLKYHNDLTPEFCRTFLPYIESQIFANDKSELNFIHNFIKNNKGAFRFIEDKSQTIEARNMVREHIIYDFVYEKAKKLEKQGAFDTV